MTDPVPSAPVAWLAEPTTVPPWHVLVRFDEKPCHPTGPPGLRYPEQGTSFPRHGFMERELDSYPDFLQTYSGMIVSKAAMLLIEDWDGYEHQFYPCLLHKSPKVNQSTGLQYFFINITKARDAVDVSKSAVEKSEYHIQFTMFGGRTFPGAHTYIEAIDKIVIHQQAVMDDHLWVNLPRTAGFFVSHKFKECLEREGMTGLEYHPCLGSSDMQSDPTEAIR